MPRKGQRKRLTRRKRSNSAPAVLCSAYKRSAKRKVWTDTQMLAAIDAAKSGCGINHHDVPSSTLKDRLSGRVIQAPSTPNSSASISKFLSSPHLLSSPDSTGSVVSPQARLLTSAAVLAEVEEKERKKQKELEEKERRKKDKEEKRKSREEEVKKKAEERAASKGKQPASRKQVLSQF